MTKASRQEQINRARRARRRVLRLSQALRAKQAQLTDAEIAAQNHQRVPGRMTDEEMRALIWINFDE